MPRVVGRAQGRPTRRVPLDNRGKQKEPWESEGFEDVPGGV